MRVIIAGSRGFSDYERLRLSMKAAFPSCELVISGCACGADQLGERWAVEHGVAVKQMPADWSLGRSAGYRRNVDMSLVADGLLAMWDGESRGTKHMIQIAVKAKLRVAVFCCGKLEMNFKENE